jgi:hypothetical protein
MNRTDINKYLTNPELISEASKEELHRLVETYPYCEALHWIYLRALYIADDAMFEEELLLHGMHISNRRLFYNYLTTDNSQTNETKTNNKQTNIETNNTPNSSFLIPNLSTPDYFALEQNQAHKQSLQQLAEQLKKARLARQEKKKEKEKEKEEEENKQQKTQNSPDKSNIPTNPTCPTNNSQFSKELTENDAKKLIKEQKYLEAIEILRAISLNNPKKSANFALQIKFLETIINNHNKKQ